MILGIPNQQASASGLIWEPLGLPYVWLDFEEDTGSTVVLDGGQIDTVTDRANGFVFQREPALTTYGPHDTEDGADFQGPNLGAITSATAGDVLRYTCSASEGLDGYESHTFVVLDNWVARDSAAPIFSYTDDNQYHWHLLYDDKWQYRDLSLTARSATATASFSDTSRNMIYGGQSAADNRVCEFNAQNTGTDTGAATSTLALGGDFWVAVSRLPTGGFPSYNLKGTVREIICVKGALSADNQDKIEGYLAWKWGIQGNLPAGHTYKSAPPTYESEIPLALGASQWFDASNDAGLVKADGDTTADQLLDLSGNGNDTGSPPSAALRPALGTLNSLQCLDFTSGDGWENVPNAIGSDGTVFVAMQSSDSSYTIVCTDGTPDGYYWAVQDGSSSTTLSGSSGTPTLYRTGNLIAGGTTRDQLHTATNGNTYIQGAKHLNAGTWGTPHTIGRYTAFSTFYFAGKVGEIVVFDYALNDSARQTMEGYLAWKWGCQADLPAWHPYVSAPPGSTAPELPLWDTSYTTQKTYSNGDRTIQLTPSTNAWRAAIGLTNNATFSNGNKYYTEVIWDAEGASAVTDAFIGVGWNAISDNAIYRNNVDLGLIWYRTADATADYITVDSGANWNSTGAGIGAVAPGDRIGIAMDLDNGILWVKGITNGFGWNGDPVAGTGGARVDINTTPQTAWTGTIKATYDPFLYFGGFYHTNQWTLPTTHANAAPSGFTAIIP